jgi:opacity protein-like surface antigen
MRVALAVLMCCSAPAWASAQVLRPELPTTDALISVGWAGSEYEIQSYDRWRGSLFVGVAGGHYWTDHLKTEAEVSWNSPGRGTIFENVEYQGGQTYSESGFRSHDIRAGIAQVYQFRRNQWVHPFVGAGVDLVRRDVHVDRPQQVRTVYFPNRNVPVVVPAASEHKTTLFAQPFIKTGMKMYVSDRAFFTTDFKVGFRRDAEHVVWKIGLGFDF